MTTLSTTLAKRLEDPRLFRQYAYVNGKWTHGEGGREEAVYDPATNEAIGHIPLLEAEQITAAVDAAEAAFARARSDSRTPPLRLRPTAALWLLLTLSAP